MKSIVRSLLIVSVFTLADSAFGDEFSDFRGIWVSRFEYNEDSTSSIQSVINNAADMGITDIMFQVRGKADSYYNSNFEPRAENWTSGTDPLQIALDAAHARGVKLHAWLNTMPLWRDSTQPADSSHIFYNSNPSFRVTDINGNVEQLVGGSSTFSGSYARVNHVLPEVQTHLNNVVNDIATNYDVDGVHLDYIRWLGPSGGSSESFRPDWDYMPHDAYTHQLYFNETGQVGSDGSTFAKREAYRDWVQGKITDLVTTIGQTVDAAEISEGRTIQLSAAVWNNPTTAERDYMQDYRNWLQNDLLDIAMPMVYLSQSNSNLMDGFLSDILGTPTNTHVSIGLGTYLHTTSGGGVNETISQLQKVYDSTADSATFYNYASMFGGATDEARRQAVIDWYDGLIDTPVDGGLSPDATLITGFDLAGDEGYFNLPPTFSGSTEGVANATAAQTFVEDHIGGGSQLLTVTDDSTPGWFVRHLAGGGSPGNNLSIDADGHVGFWLKTSTPGLTVQIAVDDPLTADLGTVKSVNADGQWRLYEWDLSDDSQWEGWVNGDGSITGPTLTLDSIQITGTGNAEFYIDTIAHNSLGSLLASSGDFDGNGSVDANDFFAWQRETSLGSLADWEANYASATTAAAAAVPEPSGPVMVMAALSLGLLRRLR